MRTVDANTARPADFRTLQEANDSEQVANGDVLHVMPSTVGYGNLLLSKGLAIIGPGYLLNQNLNFTVAAPSARTGTITISKGADGSLITGLETGSITFTHVSFVYSNNLTIKRNYIQGNILSGSGANGSNVQILQNHITGYLELDATANSGLLVRGNFLGSYLDASNSGDSGIVAFNVVNHTGSSAYGGSMLVENNLYRGSISIAGSALARNNWSPDTYPNDSTWTPATTFANQFLADGSVDGRWRLRAGADVGGTATDGTDPGHFSGPDPYVLSGLPAVPLVSGLRAPSSASAASGLPVAVDVQVNP